MKEITINSENLCKTGFYVVAFCVVVAGLSAECNEEIS